MITIRAALLAVLVACTGARHPREPGCEDAIGSWTLAVRWSPAPPACPALPWDRPLAVVVERIVDSGAPHVFDDRQPAWESTAVRARELSARGGCRFDVAFSDRATPATSVDAHVELRSGGGGDAELDGADPACRASGRVTVTPTAP